MLTILTDPLGATGRQRHPWDYSVSIQKNIERHLSCGGDCEVRINGELIDPFFDARLDAPPCVADFVTVLRRPEGFDPITWAYIAIAALAVVSFAMMPRIPGSSTSKDSPNNSLTAQTNVARAYQAIPDVYGYRRCWPDLIQPSTVEYVDHLKYVTEWLCISRGVGTITEVQFAETPIGDVDGASYEVFAPDAGAGYPEHRQTTIADVIETFASEEVNGQELPYAEAFPAVTRAGSFSAAVGATTFTVTMADGDDLANLKSISPGGSALVEFAYGTGPTDFSETCAVVGFLVTGGSCTFTFGSSAWLADEAASTSFTLSPNGQTTTTLGPYTLPLTGDRIRWNTVFLRGLKGDVDVRSEWWQIDSAGLEVPGTREQRDDTYSANTYDSRYWTTEVTPASGNGRYRIQFTRLSQQESSSGADVAKLEELYSVRHYPTKVLPGVTIIRVTTKATIEATGYSERKFNLRWQRHVRTLDDDGLSASRNFARSMSHAWTIAGNDIAQLDIDALAGVNAEHGEDSPLLRFDGSLDDADMSLGERLQLMADTARCVVWRDGTKWTVTRDQARPSGPDLQIDYRNLAAGGDSAVSYSAHLPASNDGVELEYVDEAEQSKKAYVRLSISTGTPFYGEAENPLKIKLPGCTTQAQADNRAQLEARRLLYQRTSVQDKALADVGSVGIGACVRWVDPNDLAGDDGLQAGEVMAIAGDVIATSEPIDWRDGGDGRVLLTGKDGRYLGSAVRCYPVPGGLRLANVPAGIFVAGGDRQCGSRYAFAVGLTDAEIEAAGLFTVTEIKPASDGTVSIACASYDDRIYEADA